MIQYFARDYTGNPFILFGSAHLIALAIIAVINIALFLLPPLNERNKTRIQWVMACILWANEIIWHLWNIAWGSWTISTMLPLHICSIMVWLSGIMLVTKNFRIYEFAYFIGIGGALQAILTPDAGIYGFPHFRAFQTFISHGMIITAAIYMTRVVGFRPTWKSMIRVIVGLNIYAAIVYPINILLSTNYLFINQKPSTASLLDLLPPWPIYILFMELIGFVIFLILYLPFLIHDIRIKHSRRK